MAKRKNKYKILMWIGPFFWFRVDRLFPKANPIKSFRVTILGLHIIFTKIDKKWIKK